MEFRERLAGVLLGTAVGDALGLACEGMSAKRIARRFGRVDRYHLLGRTGYVSDDTEQSALVAQSLARQPAQRDRCVKAFRRSLLGWFWRLPWGVGLAMSGANRVSDVFREFLIDATALAALGTIADVVPLTGENRIIAHYGLGNLKRSKLTGIQALIDSAGLNGQILDSYHVGFLLAPRLNASGRMGHAGLAVELLTEATPERARDTQACGSSFTRRLPRVTDWPKCPRGKTIRSHPSIRMR